MEESSYMINNIKFYRRTQESARGSWVGQNEKRENKPRGQSLSVAKTRQTK